MQKRKNLTLKRLQKNHKINQQDKELHKTIEKGTVDKKKFDELVKKAIEQEAFDKKPS